MNGTEGKKGEMIGTIHSHILNNKDGYMHKWCVGGEVQNDSL
jgi:hypothetical protein